MCFSWSLHVHRCVLSRVAAHNVPLSRIGRAKSNRGIDIVYSRAACDSWIAKIARDNAAGMQLRREYDALEQLKPWAEQLNVPQVLAWDDEPADVCLIQTLLPGTYERVTFAVSDSQAAMMRMLGAPLRWVETFVQAVRLRDPQDTRAVTEKLVRELEAGTDVRTSFPAFLDMLSADARACNTAGVPTHGDFFPGNVAYRDAGIAVYDWEGLGPGYPLQDTFSYIVNSDYCSNGRTCTWAEKYRHVFFSESAAAAIVSDVIAGARLSREAVRHCFYGFLATQLSGKGLKPSDWKPLLSELDAAGYPAPGTVMMLN